MLEGRLSKLEKMFKVERGEAIIIINDLETPYEYYVIDALGCRTMNEKDYREWRRNP